MGIHFVIEASHLFRAGEIHSAQLYVIDVVNYLGSKILNAPVEKSWVLFGSTKNIQAEKYIQAVERTGINVIRMTAIDSRITPGSKFYKSSNYLQEIFNELPKGSHVCLVGFHNTRFEDLLKAYAKDYKISLAAFTTKSKSNNDMKIPPQFFQYLHKVVVLDQHVDGIKSMYVKPELVSGE